MAIPTEPIGSIPRPPWLIEAITATGGTAANYAITDVSGTLSCRSAVPSS